MSHSFEVLFDGPLAVRRERAILAQRVLTPVDRYTGRIVAEGIAAEIPAEQAKARRSLRGHLVFEGLSSPAPHIVEISTRSSGYFTIDPLAFPLPQDFTDDSQRLVRLDLRPEFVIDGSAAIVRGGVRRGEAWIGGARVSGAFETIPADAGDPVPFETRTSETGVFALRLRPPPANQASGPVSVPFQRTVRLEVEHDGQVHAVAEVPVVRDMETTTLAQIIDLPVP